MANGRWQTSPCMVHVACSGSARSCERPLVAAGLSKLPRALAGRGGDCAALYIGSPSLQSPGSTQCVSRRLVLLLGVGCWAGAARCPTLSILLLQCSSVLSCPSVYTGVPSSCRQVMGAEGEELPSGTQQAQKSIRGLPCLPP